MFGTLAIASAFPRGAWHRQQYLGPLSDLLAQWRVSQPSPDLAI